MRPRGTQNLGPGAGFGPRPPFITPPPNAMIGQQQLLRMQQVQQQFQNQRVIQQQQAAIRELQQKTLMKQQQHPANPTSGLNHPCMGMLNPPIDFARQPPNLNNNFSVAPFNDYSATPAQQPPGFSKPGLNPNFTAPSSNQMIPQPFLNRPAHTASDFHASKAPDTGVSYERGSNSRFSPQNISVVCSQRDAKGSAMRDNKSSQNDVRDDRSSQSLSTRSRSGSHGSSFSSQNSRDRSREQSRDKQGESGSRYRLSSGKGDSGSNSRDPQRDERKEGSTFGKTRDYSGERYRREKSRSSRSPVPRSRSARRFDSETRSSSSKISDNLMDSNQDSRRYRDRSENRQRDSKYYKSSRDSSREFERSPRPDRQDKQERAPSRSRRERSLSSESSSQRKSRMGSKSHSVGRSAQSSPYRRARISGDSDKSYNVESESYEDSQSRKKTDCFSTSDNFDPEVKEAVEEVDNIIYTIRSCPADLYFMRDSEAGTMTGSKRMVELENKFEEEIVDRSDKLRQTQDATEKPHEPNPTPCHSHHHHHHHKCSGSQSSSSSSCDSSSDDDDDDDEGNCNHIVEEWTRRKKNPYNLHPELWYNEEGQVNDGPLCRCSIKSRKTGIRHDIYPGETPIQQCDPESNNADKLFHYRVTMSPYTNFLTKTPTLIEYDNHEYIFEGFSLFTHEKLENVPACKLLRFNIEYTIHLIEETAPENFTVRSLNLFNKFLFHEVLELVDLDWGTKEGGCNRFHFMPRFSRSLPDSGCKEVLSMNTVLNFLLKSSKPLVAESQLSEMENSSDDAWRTLVDAIRGMIVTRPGMRPSSVRIDQLDRTGASRSSTSDGHDDHSESARKQKPKSKYPLIIHQGCRPAQLSYAGDPLYRKAWKQYVKYRHLLNSKPKILSSDKQRLKEQEEKLQDICLKKTMKREVTIEMESQGFLCTGLRADLCQHALMIPVLMSHLRFHICLDVLEEQINYKFQDRSLLQLALTHTSYRTNYGTNPDHTRNSLTNCGMRQVEYGDRRIHYQNTRKRGICILLDIMSRFGKQEETLSEIPHNERLEFLGDAVIEFLTSVHLFYMFPWLEEGGLSTYRMALVQNQHLAQLAKKLKLQDFMLYVHGPDLCHESDLRHAMANCCEALMGALFMDGGLEVVDAIFSRTLFDDESVLLNTWNDVPKHVLQQEEPGGDRHWIKSSPILQKLENFEESIGVKFNHIRLLAKAFTHRNIGDNPLTHGHNQRLEFLGDTVLQLVASEYLYRHYPEHHEGHLSLLRSSLVNSRTQGLVYDDLGMSEYVIFNEDALSDGLDMKTKQRADMLESFIGALYVDKGLDFCWGFCNVCFFPRLKDFITNQDWNDPKSQLQQCCLTLREVGGGEPDIPIYKVIESIGPTNTRKYVVAVYFRGSRLATGNGHSIQQAEMSAATNALKKREELFPILQHQRRFLEKLKQGLLGKDEVAGKSTHRKSSVSPRKRRRYNPRDK